jgi:hypothetical protein
MIIQTAPTPADPDADRAAELVAATAAAPPLVGAAVAAAAAVPASAASAAVPGSPAVAAVLPARGSPNTETRRLQADPKLMY